MTISDYSQADCVYTLTDLECVRLSDMQARANGRWESELCGGKERRNEVACQREVAGRLFAFGRRRVTH